MTCALDSVIIVKLMSNRFNKLAAVAIPILREIFAEPRKFETPGLKFTYGEREWSLSPEEAQQFHHVVKVISATFPLVHQKTCACELQRFCCEHIPSHGAPFESSFESLLNKLHKLSTISNIAYVQLSGIRLEVPECEVGNVRIIPGTYPEVDNLRLTIKDINGKHPAPVDPAIVLARVEVTGEPEHALESARDCAQVALDCLQFISIRENHAAFSDSLGFILACSSPVPLVDERKWLYSNDGPTWQSSQGLSEIVATINPQLNLPLNAKMLEVLNERGLSHIHNLLRDPTPSSFDEGVLAAISWIAYSIRERSLTRKYLGFHIALEALFTRDSSTARSSSDYQAPSVAVDEGVAYLLGKDTQTRIKIAERMRELCRTRNMIVHRGYTAVERADLLTLAHFSWNCCQQGLKMRDKFKEDNSFRIWCQNKKFETAE